MKEANELGFNLPDWQKSFADESALHAFLREIHPKVGWHLKGGDTLLLINRLGGGFTVFVWADFDPRQQYTELAKLPEFSYSSAQKQIYGPIEF